MSIDATPEGTTAAGRPGRRPLSPTLSPEYRGEGVGRRGRLRCAAVASIIVALVTLVTLSPAHPALALPPPKPVPPSPYLPLVYRYADAMLRGGRDTHGPQETGLLLSISTRPAPGPPAGGPAVAHPQNDQNLLRVLYTLSELSTKPAYREAADAELRWLLRNPGTDDPPWDANFAWDVEADQPILAPVTGRVPPRPWVLWDRCFELEPAASRRLVAGLRRRRAGDDGGTAAARFRRGGFAVRAYAVAYRHTRDGAMLTAIEEELGRMAAGPADGDAAVRVSAAIDCNGAAALVPPPLAKRLRDFAAREDRAFCALPHDPKGKGGFATGGDAAAAAAVTPSWLAERGAYTTAAVAMMCVSRYENTGDVRYRALILAAADAYRAADAAPPAGAWPVTFGQAISLQLAAWRATARREYLDRAIELADLAVKTFWDDGGPLLRAHAGARHYGTAKGADTLALSLVELHLSILGITAVRPPPNTIDR